MIMETIAATTAFIGLYTSWQNAQAQKDAGYATGREYDEQARRTLLTARWNIAKTKEKALAVSHNIEKIGADRAALFKRAGIQKEGQIAPEVAASNVKVSSGTPAQQIIKARLDTAAGIMKNLEEINFAQRKLTGEAEDKMENTWYMAEQKADKYRRMADLARSGADSAYFAGMMGGFTDSINTYSNLGGFKNAESWYSGASAPKKPKDPKKPKA